MKCVFRSENWIAESPEKITVSERAFSTGPRFGLSVQSASEDALMNNVADTNRAAKTVDHHAEFKVDASRAEVDSIQVVIPRSVKLPKQATIVMANVTMPRSAGSKNLAMTT